MPGYVRYMTCVVGIRGSNNSIHMGADSCISDGDSSRILVDPKVFVRGQFAIGSAGSLRVLQLVHYCMTIPPIKIRSPEKYLITSFINSMRKCLKRSGASREEHKEEEQDNSFIIGFKGRLFTIDAVYSVCEIADYFTAIGSGEDYALGSLFTTIGEPVKTRIKKALDAASHFSSFVSPPYHMIRLPPPKS